MIKLDESAITAQLANARFMIDEISDLISALESNETGIFNKYMAIAKLGAYSKNFQLTNRLALSLLGLGFGVSHPEINDEAKEHGWIIGGECGILEEVSGEAE